MKNIIDFLYKDYCSWPLRFVIEIMAWVMSIGANVMFALTVPNVSFLLYLTITVTSCAMYAWAAWTRRSTGMLANYLLLTTIDSFALSRILF